TFGQSKIRNSRGPAVVKSGLRVKDPELERNRKIPGNHGNRSQRIGAATFGYERKSMIKHEIKYCPRCEAAFECKVGSILLCQCTTVHFEDEERDYINSQYD